MQRTSLILALFFTAAFELVGLLLWKLEVGVELFAARDGQLWMRGPLGPISVAPDTPEGRKRLSRQVGWVFMATGLLPPLLAAAAH